MAKQVVMASGNVHQQVEQFASLRAAKDEFFLIATDLARFGQEFVATLHFGTKDPYEAYPDFVLSLGVRGGLKVEST